MIAIEKLLQGARKEYFLVFCSLFCCTVDWEIFVAKKFSAVTFNDENQNGEIFFPRISEVILFFE